jgi:hypothetical protein
MDVLRYKRVNMSEITTICEITGEGMLKIIKRREFDLCIKTAPKGKWFMVITKIYRKRSLNQNAYYHAVCVQLVKDGLFDVGYKLTNDQTHEYLKEMFLRHEITNETTGEVKYINRSTTELKTIEFNEYIDNIISWADEYLGIKIPLPNEFND